MKSTFFAAVSLATLLLAGCDNQSEEAPATSAPTAEAVVTPLSDADKAVVDALGSDIDKLLAALSAAPSGSALSEYVDARLAAVITSTDAEDLPPQLWRRIPNFTASRRAAVTK